MTHCGVFISELDCREWILEYRSLWHVDVEHDSTYTKRQLLVDKVLAERFHNALFVNVTVEHY